MDVGVDEAWDDDAAGEILKGFVGVLRGEERGGTDGGDGVVGDEDGACVEVDGAGFVEGEDCCVCVEHFLSFSFFSDVCFLLVKERGIIGKRLESGWEVRDGVGGTYLLRYSTCMLPWVCGCW